MENFEQSLQKAGLTGNESKIYTELLKAGPLSANELAKKIEMDRTLSYTVLNHLIKKGMVSYIIKSGKKFFEASDPSNLLNPLKEKEIFTKDLIEQLKKIEKIKETKSEINIYEGKEGLRTLMRIIIKHKHFCSFGATGRAYDYLYELSALSKELATKKEFFAQIITSSPFKKHPFLKLKNIEAKYLNIKSEATTSIFGDYISIHLILPKPLIILIKNKEIAESYQNHFKILWKIAKSI